MNQAMKPSNWAPPADWRPYTKGNPGRGRVKVVGHDGKSYSRPRTAEEQAAWETRKTDTAPAGQSEGRLSVARLAEAMRNHLQMREKFTAVLDEAHLSPKAIENLIQWLTEWRTDVARREIQRKELDLKKLQAEIATLRRASQSA